MSSIQHTGLCGPYGSWQGLGGPGVATSLTQVTKKGSGKNKEPEPKSEDWSQRAGNAGR